MFYLLGTKMASFDTGFQHPFKVRRKVINSLVMDWSSVNGEIVNAIVRAGSIVEKDYVGSLNEPLII